MADIRRQQQAVRKQLAQTESERDAYHRTLMAWARARVPTATLERWANTVEDGVNFDQVIKQLTKKR